MSENQNNICIINAQSGIGTSSPQISRFTHNFSSLKFVIEKDFSDYALVVITCIDGKVNAVTEGEFLIKSYDAETKSTNLLWYPQREITADSGVVVYQIAAYNTAENKAVWYSKEGRLIVTDSIDTTDLSAELIGSSPNLITQILLMAKGVENNLQHVQDSINAINEETANIENSISDLSQDLNLYKSTVHLGEKEYNPLSSMAQSGIAVSQALASLVDSAPEALNTLEELANALGNDPNFATTIMEMMGKKVEKDAYNADMGIVNQDIDNLEEDLHYHKNNGNNPHRVTKDQIGLGNVDNTADKDKPVSDAVVAELNKKVDKVAGKGLSTNDFTDTYKELVDENNHRIGVLEHLKTDNVDNLVSAINEVYDGKVFKIPYHGLVLIEPVPNNDGEFNWDMVLIANRPILEDGSVMEEGHSVTVYSVEGANNRFCPTPITVIPTTLKANKQYNFGEVETLNLAFPTVATDGDVIYLTFKSGSTPTALTIDTTNTSDIEVIPEANTGYEIFGKFNREIWIVNYSEYTVSEG